MVRNVFKLRAFFIVSILGKILGAILKTVKVACEDSEIGPSGGFYQDRESVAKHLPLAWSKESQADRTKLLEMLDQYFEQTKAK